MPTLRERLTQNPMVAGGIAAVVLLIAVSLVMKRQTPLQGAYFYDLGANKLYVAPQGTLPPAVAPSGGQGVQAIVFSCGNCADLASHYIGYLQTFTDAYRKAVENGDELTEDMLFEGQLIRTVDGDTWHPQDNEAAAIVTAARQRCDNGQPETCRPM